MVRAGCARPLLMPQQRGILQHSQLFPALAIQQLAGVVRPCALLELFLELDVRYLQSFGVLLAAVAAKTQVVLDCALEPLPPQGFSLGRVGLLLEEEGILVAMLRQAVLTIFQPPSSSLKDLQKPRFFLSDRCSCARRSGVMSLLFQMRYLNCLAASLLASLLERSTCVRWKASLFLFEAVSCCVCEWVSTFSLTSFCCGLMAFLVFQMRQVRGLRYTFFFQCCLISLGLSFLSSSESLSEERSLGDERKSFWLVLRQRCRNMAIKISRGEYKNKSLGCPEVEGVASRLALLFDRLNLLEEGLLVLVEDFVVAAHLPFLHVFPNPQQLLLKITEFGLHDVLQLYDVRDIGRDLLVLLVVEMRDPEERQLSEFVLEPHCGQVFDSHIPVDLHIVDHLVGLIEAVLLGHFLEHLLVLLKVLEGDVLLRELGEQPDLRLHLYEAAVVHEYVVGLAVLHKLAEDELGLLLVRLDVALDELDVLRLDVGLHDGPQLLLAHQLQPLVLVLDDGDLRGCVLMHLVDLVLLLVLLVAVEGVVLGPIVEVVVAEPVLEARNDRLEILNVVVFAVVVVGH